MLEFPNRPVWALNSGRVLVSPGELNLKESEWLGEQAGILRADGPLFRNSTLAVDLTIEGRGVLLTSVVHKKWKEFVQGALNGDAVLLASKEMLSIKGEASGDGVKLVGIPALRAMQNATGITRWTELPLDICYTQFHYQNQQLKFTKAIFESENLVRLEGELSAGPENKLDGLFQVGLSDRAVSKIPGARTAVFNLEQNNYLWASPPMQVFGTTDKPQEDLSPRLKGAIIEAIGEKVKEKIDQGANLLDTLLQSIP